MVIIYRDLFLQHSFKNKITWRFLCIWEHCCQLAISFPPKKRNKKHTKTQYLEKRQPPRFFRQSRWRLASPAPCWAPWCFLCLWRILRTTAIRTQIFGKFQDSGFRKKHSDRSFWDGPIFKMSSTKRRMWRAEIDRSTMVPIEDTWDCYYCYIWLHEWLIFVDGKCC